MMNAKKTLSIIAGAAAGALALAACSGPQEENLRMVPLTVPTTMPMTSYGPNTRVVVAGVDYTEVHDEWMNQDSNLYDASMPYFMRLTDSGIGMHVGPVFQTPQSHGCIRMTRSSCVPLFKTVKVGTPVTIVQ